MTGMEKAVALVGSQRALAAALGVTQQAVWDWVNRGYAPIDRVHDILDIVDPVCEDISVADLVDPRYVKALLHKGRMIDFKRISAE